MASAQTPTPASSRDDFTWSGRIPAGATLRLRDVAGSISVEPSTSGSAEIVGRKEWRRGDPADVHFDVVHRGDDVVICAVWFNDRCEPPNITIPRVGRTRSNDVAVHFTVRLPAGVRLDATGVSADIRVRGATAGVSAQSVSGALRISDVTGDIAASTVSGDLVLTAIRATSISAETVSGDITADAASVTGTKPLHFESVSGAITVSLPAGVDANLRMNTVSGRLRSEFPLTLQGSLGRDLSSQLGRGGRTLSIETVSGDVTLRKR
jgi:hypothetical protein